MFVVAIKELHGFIRVKTKAAHAGDGIQVLEFCFLNEELAGAILCSDDCGRFCILF